MFRTRSRLLAFMKFCGYIGIAVILVAEATLFPATNLPATWEAS